MAMFSAFFRFVILFISLELVFGAKFLLTVPKNPHYDTKFTATVTASGIFERETIELIYTGFRDSSRIFHRVGMSFEFDGSKTWTVEFPWVQMQQFQEDGVVLTLGSLYDEVKETLMFSKNTGYIFIQTDKPLYTPRQTVKFRIIAVDEYQRLAKYPLKVDIKNEQDIVIDRIRYTAEEAFKAQEFELPKETPPGNWTITANFEGMNLQLNSGQTATFEVREYVLPRFSANIKISSDVITKDTHWITVEVSAKYVYGQNTMGTAEMQLGIWDPNLGLKLLPTKYSGNLTKGVYKQDVMVSKLIGRDMFVRANRRLYINVNVTEEGTGENDTIVDTSTFIAHPFYSISFDHSKKHFKPGFPYSLHTHVRAQSGRPASWLKMVVQATFFGGDGKKVSETHSNYALDDQGFSLANFEIPKNVHICKFKIYVLDFKAGTNNNAELKIFKLKSPNQQYMHISLVKPIEKHANGLIKLRYTPEPKFAGFGFARTRITLLVLSKGGIVFSDSVLRNKDGNSLITLPKSLYTEVSPSMRIVASFCHETAGKCEYVIDSLQVDTTDVCVEELNLLPPGGRFARPGPKKPKEQFDLKVHGGKGMTVGLVAVDKAVFLLNNAQTLTRQSLFDQFASHDQGTGSGDGINMNEVFKNSGLIFLHLNTGVQEEETKVVKGWGLSVSSSFKGNRYLFQVLHPLKPRLVATTYTEPPPQSVRRYFPESWLFEEHTLAKNGRKTLKLTLPDSITTWSFMAVGLSANRGVCISKPLEQKVQKLFFVDVRIPYKVTRLEEVKVKVAVYNYHSEPISLTLEVKGSEGMCFSSNRVRGNKNQNSTKTTMRIGARRTKSKDVKVIPLENGELTLLVDAYTGTERDTVEKKLHVVAEGLRLRKSLTFVLDPEAQHAKFKSKKRQTITLEETSTIFNAISLKDNTQKTIIDLAMPQEVIRGTEKCKISAFGDLMGDIINHAVVKSKSLVDQTVQNAEEVLGDLGPTVHALLYANQSGIMDKALTEKARRFVRHGVQRLLRYRTGSAYRLTPESQEGTWLTATILKTLCSASSLAFIDKEHLIDDGFFWLLEQITENQTLTERDWRLAKDSWDYKVMLSAEVLIAILECGRSEFEDHVMLMEEMAIFLEDNLADVEEPMVLAKVAYALSLYDPVYEATKVAVDKLSKIARTNQNGQMYWASEQVTEEHKKVPFWYRKGVKSSAIEATAFALLVYINSPDAFLHKYISGSRYNVDAIADWLVSQRNHHGSFITALDSTAAIQALSAYSLRKAGIKLDLLCNVTSDKQKHISHSFKFTERNAIRPESLSNVPVGHTLEVLTKGQGLGQMQINVEYNIPIDPNLKCAFNVTVEVKRTEVNLDPDMIPDPICISCGWDCRRKPIEIEETPMNCTGNYTFGNDTFYNCTDEDDDYNMTTTSAPTDNSTPENLSIELQASPIGIRRRGRNNIGRVRTRLFKQRGRTQTQQKEKKKSLKPKRINLRRRNRNRRSTVGNNGNSKRSICIKVCLQHVEQGGAGHTRVDIDMISGYLPFKADIERLRKQDNVVYIGYEPSDDSLILILKKVSDEETSCLSFRAVEEEEVGRALPAVVTVFEVGNPDPSCAVEYTSPTNKESLQVYCADFSRINRGECRCYSGKCSSCRPTSHFESISYVDMKKTVCGADVGYQVQISHVEDRDQWVEIDAKVLSVNKTGTHEVKVNDTIKLMSPSSCMCPTFYGKDDDKLYLISSDVERMVDSFGNTVNQYYLLDEQSTFLRVWDPSFNKTGMTSKQLYCYPAGVEHTFLKQAFITCHKGP